MRVDFAVLLEPAPVEWKRKTRPRPRQLHHLRGSLSRSQNEAPQQHEEPEIPTVLTPHTGCSFSEGKGRVDGRGDDRHVHVIEGAYRLPGPACQARTDTGTRVLPRELDTRQQFPRHVMAAPQIATGGTRVGTAPRRAQGVVIPVGLRV